MIDWQRYHPLFVEGEFRCKCCGQALMDPEFMDWLHALRLAFAAPMIVRSGYRCPKHNAAVSRTGHDGPHTSGKAADIGIAGEAAYGLVRLAFARGVQGAGWKQHGPWHGRFVHLDRVEGAGRPTIWTYS